MNASEVMERYPALVEQFMGLLAEANPGKPDAELREKVLALIEVLNRMNPMPDMEDEAARTRAALRRFMRKLLDQPGLPEMPAQKTED